METAVEVIYSFYVTREMYIFKFLLFQTVRFFLILFLESHL